MTDAKDYELKHDAKVIADLEANNADLARTVEPLRKALGDLLPEYIYAKAIVGGTYDSDLDPLVIASRKALTGDVS